MDSISRTLSIVWFTSMHILAARSPYFFWTSGMMPKMLKDTALQLSEHTTLQTVRKIYLFILASVRRNCHRPSILTRRSSLYFGPTSQGSAHCS
ncbi:hypothetical protein CC86DRAFT_125618 [Ophiobolus disseminans]|uniref:Uncharacterized protein n=1 Tax=Ophiobolus disseminans TaxID=1469910 RepID=A0A6A6ZGJ9_9PLEO|nr:hypothetical protein CC86DRAFT_125618 [Ophiobolus disseminans]